MSFVPHLLCSSQKGGVRGVCEVDGPVCHGAARGWWLTNENLHWDHCRRHAQHPEPLVISFIAGNYYFQFWYKPDVYLHLHPGREDVNLYTILCFC